MFEAWLVIFTTLVFGLPWVFRLVGSKYPAAVLAITLILFGILIPIFGIPIDGRQTKIQLDANTWAFTPDTSYLNITSNGVFGWSISILAMFILIGAGLVLIVETFDRGI